MNLNRNNIYTAYSNKQKFFSEKVFFEPEIWQKRVGLALCQNFLSLKIGQKSEFLCTYRFITFEPFGGSSRKNKLGPALNIFLSNDTKIFKIG